MSIQYTPLQKRKLRPEAQENQAEPLLKRRKHKPKRERASPTARWDSLIPFGLPLTQHSLREFDRRTEARVFPQWPKLAVPPASRLGALQRFARQGGPDLRDVRAYREPPIDILRDMAPVRTPGLSHAIVDSPYPSRLQSTSGSTGHTAYPTTTASKLGPYDKGFSGVLATGGVYMDKQDGEALEPDNLADIWEVLDQPRLTSSASSFSREAFKDFLKANAEAQEESAVMKEILPLLLDMPHLSIRHRFNCSFRRLIPLLYGRWRDGLKSALPDYTEGSAIDDFDSQVLDELSRMIEPCIDDRDCRLPNFFVETKGWTGSLLVAERQVCYDGALGARAMHSLRRFMDPDTALDGNAYTLSATYLGYGAVLSIYATHARQSEDGSRLEYHMKCLDTWKLSSNIRNFTAGLTALRNARDWAAEQRQCHILMANDVVRRGIPARRFASARRASTSAIPRSYGDQNLGEDESGGNNNLQSAEVVL